MKNGRIIFKKCVTFSFIFGSVFDPRFGDTWRPPKMGHTNTILLRRPKFGGQKTTPKRGPKMSLGVPLFCAKQDRFLIEPRSQNIDPPTRFVGIARRPILPPRRRRPSLTV